MSYLDRIAAHPSTGPAVARFRCVAAAGAAGFAVVGAGAGVPKAAMAATSVNASAIQTLSDRFIAAWNSHSPAGIAELFTLDADFTNPFGVYAHGRPAIEAVHDKALSTVFAASSQTFESSLTRPLDARYASVELHWSMTGATVPGWPATQRGINNWIVEVQPDNSVLIAVFHGIVPLALPMKN
jgi:uncharacterized protein (TIGR02246 family)